MGIRQRLAGVRERAWGRSDAALRWMPRRIVADAACVAATVSLRLCGQGFDFRDVPVVINNHDRLTPLRLLIDWLERAGMRNIIVLDNASTYPPLLDYYRSLSHRVVYEANLGPYALWHSALWREVRDDYYIYTDSDVVPTDDCPKDAVAFLHDALQRHLPYHKAGLGLRIDDLPESYAKKSDVIEWESQYWQHPLGGDIYLARVDTTFALYRPWASGGWWARALRSGGNYVAKHLPWYEDSAHPTEEDRYYAAHARRGASTWLEGRGRSTQ